MNNEEEKKDITPFDYDDNITPIEFFENILANRFFHTGDCVSYYSNQMIDCIIKFPSYEYEFLHILSQNISSILNSIVPFYEMKDDIIIDYIIELSNYATILTNDEKYKNEYDNICKLLKDIRDMNQYPLMNWTGDVILPAIEDELD